MKKLLAFDLDGTLLGDGDISPFTLEVLERYRRAGYMIAVATGRNKQYAQRILDIVKPHGASIADGACAYVGDTLINQIFIPQSDTVQIINKLKKYHHIAGVVMNTQGGYFQSVPFPQGVTFHPDLVNATTVVPLEDFVHHQAYDFLLQSTDGDVWADIVKDFPGLYIMTYETFSIIRPQHSDKWYALALVAEALGIEPKDIIAFGDNDNDLKMLENSGVSVAMGNATDNAKKAADHICGTNEADGVAHWLLEAFPL